MDSYLGRLAFIGVRCTILVSVEKFMFRRKHLPSTKRITSATKKIPTTWEYQKKRQIQQELEQVNKKKWRRNEKEIKRRRKNPEEKCVANNNNLICHRQCFSHCSSLCVLCWLIKKPFGFVFLVAGNGSETNRKIIKSIHPEFFICCTNHF